jgi:tetratricopeptide (TPR) repeat protein
MVLPASAPDDAPRPHEPAWIERLKVILRLADRGVIVLVDGGHLARLGELTRAIARDYPEVEVHADARRLARAPKGGVVVLLPDAAQAGWLNMERPVVAHRELRLILFSDAATSARLAREAVDFFHWISHRIECPPGAVMPAVRTIQRALCARARGIAWGGGHLEEAMSAALPGRPLSIVSATLPYEKLVEAARSRGRSWVGFSGAGSAFWLRRVRWALAEAGRRGRAVLVEPAETPPGFWPAHGELMSLAEAVKVLESAGAASAGRLAALLDLEPEAVELAGNLLQGGLQERDIARAAAWAEDPGAAIGRMALANEIRLEKMSLAVARTVADTGAEKVKPEAEPIEALIRAGVGKGAPWDRLLDAAIQAADPEVAERWARKWLATGEDRPRALSVLGLALLEQGAATRAVEALRESIDCYERLSNPGPEYEVALEWLGVALSARGELTEAEKQLRRSISRSQERSGKKSSGGDGAKAALGDVLVYLGKFAEAERMLLELRRTRQASAVADSTDISALHALGNLYREREDYARSEACFRDALSKAEAHLGRESPLYGVLLDGLARALIGQRRYAESESLLRQWVTDQQSLGRRVPSRPLHDLGRALLEQGKYAQAEELFRRALDRARDDTNASQVASCSHELGRTLAEQGKYAEAEPLLRETLEIKSRVYGKAHPSYASSVHELGRIMMLEGRAADAEPMFHEAIAVVERAMGRNSPMLAVLLSNLAVCLSELGRLQEAERVCKRALQIAQSARNGSITATMLAFLARTHAQMGRLDAADTARRALRAFEEAYGKDNPVTSGVRAELETIIRGGASPKR